MYFLTDAAFEMQLSFHVWSSWIRRPLFVCSKTLSNLLMWKTEQKCFFHWYYWKQSLWSSSGSHAKWLVYWHVLHFYVVIKLNKLNGNFASSHVYNVLGVCTFTRLNVHIEPVRSLIITCLCFSYVDTCACDLFFFLTENYTVSMKKWWQRWYNMMSGILFKLVIVNCYLLLLNNKIEISQKGPHLQNLINSSVPFHHLTAKIC